MCIRDRQVQSLYCGRVGRRRAYGRYQQQGFQVDKQRYQVENWLRLWEIQKSFRRRKEQTCRVKQSFLWVSRFIIFVCYCYFWQEAHRHGLLLAPTRRRRVFLTGFLMTAFMWECQTSFWPLREQESKPWAGHCFSKLFAMEVFQFCKEVSIIRLKTTA